MDCCSVSAAQARGIPRHEESWALSQRVSPPRPGAGARALGRLGQARALARPAIPLGPDDSNIEPIANNPPDVPVIPHDVEDDIVDACMEFDNGDMATTITSFFHGVSI
ncbi:hypothetical protein GUJ93_ZPchr0005g15312 [Zizania palustris]|uniref:Uncharacterized protein n=1 Tax=Zizania palustris TaxID=103762 RepID=A0A8J5QZA5_ZIZPA|nr:hypothetical protein GUJ93_ZPchr0033g26865 [Zizania palustris]KAG8068358.1 hypothetical protein GUJ93_ZPchr0005g15312 [Zizania palustris]